MRALYYILSVCVITYALYLLISQTHLKQLIVGGNSASEGFGAGTAVIITQEGNHYGFNIEIADTDELRSQGMMYRQSVEERNGMLFLFPNSDIHAFWMRNTYIPLDILFIDENNVIVTIANHAKPKSLQTIEPSKPINKALEIKAGMATKLGIKEGDTIKYQRKDK